MGAASRQLQVGAAAGVEVNVEVAGGDDGAKSALPPMATARSPVAMTMRPSARAAQEGGVFGCDLSALQAAENLDQV